VIGPIEGPRELTIDNNQPTLFEQMQAETEARRPPLQLHTRGLQESDHTIDWDALSTGPAEAMEVGSPALPER